MEPPSTDDDLVWHYTDARGLYGICKDQHLRASHFGDLNDTMEMRFGLEVMRRVASDYRHPTVNDDLCDIGERVRTSIDKLARGLVAAPIFLVSACGGKDVLNMWQSYGANGFAIGLERKRHGSSLRVSLEREDAFYTNDVQHWRPVHYDAPSQEAHAEGALTLLHEELDQHIQAREGREWGLTPFDDDLPKRQVFEKALDQLSASIILEAASQMKDPVFYAEREWRAAFHDSPDPTPFNVPGDEYVEIDDAWSGSSTLVVGEHVGADARLRRHVKATGESGSLAIRAVRCGPNGGHRNSDMEGRVATLLTACGMDPTKIDISTSRLPYRGTR